MSPILIVAIFAAVLGIAELAHRKWHRMSSSRQQQQPTATETVYRGGFLDADGRLVIIEVFADPALDAVPWGPAFGPEGPPDWHARTEVDSAPLPSDGAGDDNPLPPGHQGKNGHWGL